MEGSGSEAGSILVTSVSGYGSGRPKNIRIRIPNNFKYEILYLQFGTAAQVENSERPVLHIGLHGGIIELTSDQTLSIEDGVRRVDGNLGQDQKIL